jgi:hypothetical protein
LALETQANFRLVAFDILFPGFALFIFIDICNEQELALGCCFGKISVIFGI